MNYDVLHNFISPVTGRVPLIKDYILIGGSDNFSIMSPKLIDMQLDIIDIRHDFDNLAASNFIVGFPNTQLPNSQVLSSLDNGFMYNTDGIVSITNNFPLPDLTYKNIWIGDANNRPQPNPIITIDNLPTLGTASINVPNPLDPTTPITISGGKIWHGTDSNRPEESTALLVVEGDVALLNFRFLSANFIMGGSSLPLKTVMPRSQFIQDLPNGLLKRADSTSILRPNYIQVAEPGVDYLPGISQPPLPGISNFLLYSNNKVYQCPITYLEDPGGNGIFNFDGGTIKALNFAAKRHNGQDASVTVEGNAYISETIGARRIILYDSKELAHRREDGVMLEGPAPLAIGTMLKWIMPSAISTEGQILQDIGANIGGGRLLGFVNMLPDGLTNTLLAQGEVGGKKTFVNATLTQNKIWVGDATNKPVESDINFAPNDASYILKTPNNNLNSAQALSELAGGILKSATLTGIISIASGGGTIGVDDYVTPTALTEAIEGVIAEATEAGSVAGTVSGTAAATAEIAAAMPGILAEAGTAGGTAGGITGAIAGTTAATSVLVTKESTSDHNADISAVNTRIDNLHIPPSNAKYILNQQASGLGQAQVLSDLIGVNYPNGGLLKVTSIDGIIKIASPTVDYADPNKENTFLENVVFDKDVKCQGSLRIPIVGIHELSINSKAGMIRFNKDI